MGDMPPLGAQGALDTLQLPLGLSARFASIPPENPHGGQGRPRPAALLGSALVQDRDGGLCGLPSARSRLERPAPILARSCRPAHHPPHLDDHQSAVQRGAGMAGAPPVPRSAALPAPFTSPEAVVQHLGAIQSYQEQFQRVFGTAVTAAGSRRPWRRIRERSSRAMLLTIASGLATGRPSQKQHNVGSPSSKARRAVAAATVA